MQGPTANATAIYSKAAGAAGVAVTATASDAFSNIWSTGMFLFSSTAGVTPTIVNHSVLFSGFTAGPSGLSLGFTPTTGNLLLILVTSGIPSGGTRAFNVGGMKDSRHNNWFQVLQQANANSSGTVGSEIIALVAPNITGGSDNITFTIDGGGSVAVDITAIEISGVGVTTSGIPAFRPLVAADLPAVNIGASGPGGVTGTLILASGGTGSDLSAAGGPHEFLAQATTGGPVTVVQPDFSDLNGFAKSVRYNNTTLVSNGFPGEVAKVDSTGQTGNIGLTTLFTPGLTGMFRASIYVAVNQVATTSSTLPDLQLQWVDGDTGNVQTATFVSGTPSANTLGTFFTGTQVMWASPSNIQYQTGDSTAYASSGGTPMTYNIHLKAEMM